MLMESMVAASTAATAQATARSRMRAGERFAALRFEQFAVVEAAHRPVGREDHGARPPPAPNSAPRPTSSTPATT